MKKKSLKELNSKGLLLFSFKRYFNGLTCDGIPSLYLCHGPSTCYLHYYNGVYVFTCHIIRDRQFEFDSLSSALSYYSRFIESSLI